MSAFRYPVILDLKGRPCLVVGGGVIAERKVTGLLAAEARVTVVSPTLSEGLTALAVEGRFCWWPREYRERDAAGFTLVMVATNDSVVNGLVAAEARALRVWVNCADDPERCDFILPSVLRRGALTVAVSTGGMSPAMARLVREDLEETLPDDYAALIEVVAEVRRVLRERALSVSWERWRKALDQEVRELVAVGRAGPARERLLERLCG